MVKDEKKFKIPKAVTVNESQFIKFWNHQYTDPNRKLYENNIRRKLTQKRILELFKWKNGGKLSEGKEKSVRKNYISRKQRKQSVPKNPTVDFLRKFLSKPGGAIWRIFWLHCNRPCNFPIYDQNVHRAMAQLKGWKNIEIPKNDTAKIDMYLKHYIDFYQRLRSSVPDTNRRIDKAVWAYGKFLKQYPLFVRWQ